MKMWDPARPRGHFVPPMHERPADKTSRVFMVAKIANERAEKEPNILIKGIELIAQRLARAKEITANLAIYLQQKTRLRFVIRIIGRKKIGE